MGFINSLFSYEYITKAHLAGLDKYKYNCVDNSPLSKYVMHPFWNTWVKIYPMWLAPNLITFTGFMCLIAQFILISWVDFSFYGYCFNRDDCLPEAALNLTSRGLQFATQTPSPDYAHVSRYVCSCIPRFFWLLVTIFQFMSHHLDGTDGKQARRTGSSSPLGELFDHGLDSWATLFLPVALFSIFGRNEEFGMSPLRMYGILWLICLSFIVSHWEKYNTGILFLPWSYDLSQVGMTFLFFATYLFGQEFWYFKLTPTFTGTDLLEAILYVFSLGLSVPFSIRNMYKALNENTNKQKSFYESVRPLFSTAYLLALNLVWINFSRSNILEVEPRTFFWLSGTLFSNISCRLIIAQMTSTRCETKNWVLLPLTAVVLLFSFRFNNAISLIFTPQLEIYALRTLAVIVTLSHVHYGICMVRQICKHLNIYCFVITSKPPKSQEIKSN